MPESLSGKMRGIVSSFRSKFMPDKISLGNWGYSKQVCLRIRSMPRKISLGNLGYSKQVCFRSRQVPGNLRKSRGIASRPVLGAGLRHRISLQQNPKGYQNGWGIKMASF